MPNTLSADGFRSILLDNTPLMDVRAPLEFNGGAFPAAVNIPLLNDEQRHLVGLEYASNGQTAAIELGMRLATPIIRSQRLRSWQQFVDQNPHGYLYCFRGGQRSKITQQWLAEAGVDFPLIEGGYKALRRYLLNQLDRLCINGNIVLLSGATGVGKTNLIQARPYAVDLEGVAKHRGSAFGKTFVEQPAQIAWENQIIVDWLRSEASNEHPVVLEAESHLIGRIHLPKALQNAMQKAPNVVLEAPMLERVERLYCEYVEQNLQHLRKTVEDPWDTLQASILENLTRIRKRLGGLHYKRLCDMVPVAINELRQHDDRSAFFEIIECLLTNYYDRLYQYHQDNNRARTVYRGRADEVLGWLNGDTSRALSVS